MLDRIDDDLSGAEQNLVAADFEAERRRIDVVLQDLAGETATPRLQLSWSRGRVVAWSGGREAAPESADEVLERVAAAGGPADVWGSHPPVVLPDDTKAEAVAAPLDATLGWLVSLGSVDGDAAAEQGLGASAAWLGRVAVLAVRLVAQGRMVPQLDTQEEPGEFAVRWAPALMDGAELSALAAAMPGAVAAVESAPESHRLVRAVVRGCVDAVCRDAASRLPMPAPPPRPRTAAEVAESVLARLDGSSLRTPSQHADELGRSLRDWGRPALGTARLRLVVQLDPPDDAGAWHLQTLAPTEPGRLDPVERAMSKAPDSRRQAIKSELERLENLYEPLAEDRSRHRGEVALGQDEAWELMTSLGADLQAAGFEIRVPPLSRRKPSPSLRAIATDRSGTAVGSRELTTVRWSAVFDGVELDTEDIARLSRQSRPLVKAHGRWVELDHADLQEAAEALAEAEATVSGAQMLRYALDLDTGPLSGGISVEGESWAADLLRSAQDIPEDPTRQPPGFEGELRSYQAEAVAWLDFLDGAGLGGCLALDMGLGKTPTVLAHVRTHRERGPALVIAPLAVIGNWASEAERFVPDLDVLVHHGTDRPEADEFADEVAGRDMIVTTYATATRDIEALEAIGWGQVVLDEAQAIKNPATETAQQLRRLPAHTRLVLTGTPIENGLSDLWALMDFANPGLLGDRSSFVAQLSRDGSGDDSAERVLRTLNGVLVFRRTKAEPAIADELPDRIDELDHCPMTPEQIGLYQAVLDELVVPDVGSNRQGAVLAAITALKQICDHPAAYTGDDEPLEGRSGKLARLEEIVSNVFEAGERMLVFTHFATWGERLAGYLTERTGLPIECYHGGVARSEREAMVRRFQEGEGPGALILSLKAGGSGLNLTAASHVVLYDRWWNPAVEDQARDRAWRIGQPRTVVCHRLVCPGTIDERVEEVVEDKRRIADMALPTSSSVGDLDDQQLRRALGLDPEHVLTEDPEPSR